MFIGYMQKQSGNVLTPRRSDNAIWYI